LKCLSPACRRLAQEVLGENEFYRSSLKLAKGQFEF
jgi:hypothetical protein